MRFSAPNKHIAVLSSGFSGQDVNGFVHRGVVSNERASEIQHFKLITNVITATLLSIGSSDGLISALAFRRLSYYFSGCHSCPRYSSVQDIRSMEYLPEADADGSYINESERNVHVWCSIVKPCSYDSTKFTNKPTLGLIAGKFGICIRTYPVLLISRLLYTQRVAAGFRVV